MTRPLNIAMVAACPFPCARGTPVRIHRMAEALALRGHTVHLVTYHLGEALPNPPFQVHRTPWLPTYRKESPGPSLQKLAVVDPLLSVVLARVLRQYPIDLVHAHHYEGMMAASVVARWTGHPVIYDAHTLLESELSHYFPAALRGITSRVGSWLDRWIPRYAVHVIAVSEAIRQGLVASGAVPADRVAVVGNGVEQAHFDASLDGAYQRSVETLIFTGNLAPYQGVDLMLRSFRRVLDRRPAARLRIVSESSFEPYESLARTLGVRASIDLVLDTSFDALPRHLAEATIALNPRIYCHGIPLKLLNYMAAAKPIVSFAGSAHGLEHARTAWVAPDADVAAFAEGIVTLLKHPELARQLGTSARAYSRATFSWDRTAQQVEQVYATVLPDHDRRGQDRVSAEIALVS